MRILKEWRKKNGLDYNGWFGFLVKRYMRRYGLKRLIPFDMHQSWSNSHNVIITYWVWGKGNTEQLSFRDGLFPTDIQDRARANGLTSSKARYLLLKSLAKNQRR